MSKSTEALADLLEERQQPGANVVDVDRRILSLFGETWCVVFTGLASSERRSADTDIITFLAHVHELDKITEPIVQKNCGFTLKKTAGSCMMIFRDPKAALRTCVEIQQSLAQHNRHAPAADHLLLGCGIGFGPCIKLGDDDIFGVEVNLAAWLGEATAGPYEVLLTPSALKAVGPTDGVRFEELNDVDKKLSWLRAAFMAVPAGAAAIPGVAGAHVVTRSKNGASKNGAARPRRGKKNASARSR
jgi:class 3 adenylate cyclase